jgi:hypothetical protein
MQVRRHDFHVMVGFVENVHRSELGHGHAIGLEGTPNQLAVQSNPGVVTFRFAN